MTEISNKTCIAISCIVFLLFSLAQSNVSIADEAITFPPSGAPNPSGFKMTIGTRWSNAEGYRAYPILIEDFGMANPNEDREFKVEIFSRNYYRFRNTNNIDRKVVVDVIIPAGKRSGFAYALMPQSTDANSEVRNIDPTVYLNGRKLSDLSTDRNRRYYGRPQMVRPAQNPIVLQKNATILKGTDSAFSTLVIDSDVETFDQRRNGSIIQPAVLKNSSTLSSRVPLIHHLRSNNNTTRTRRNRVGAPVFFLPLTEVPEKFVGLSAFRRIVISLNDLEKLANQKNGESFSALKDWTAAGNVLYIVEVNFGSKGDPGEYLGKRIQKIESLFETKESRSSEYPWRIARAARGRANNGQLGTLAVDEIEVESLEDLLLKHPIQFSRRFGTGEIIGVRGRLQTLHLNVSSNDLNHTTELERLSTRNGFVPEVSQGATSFAIEGVGLPPANTFRILITLFFAIVGPLNYILLRRWKRLNLLLFTLPTFAALACLSLVAYSYLSDGLTARGRVVSYSILDQDNGRVVSYSRQTFYNALSVRDGYVFPNDALAFPHVKSQPRGDCEIEWESEIQRLRRGNIGVRSISSFGVVRSAETSTRLEVSKNGESLSIENGLKSNILIGFAWDAEGNLYKIPSIENGETATATVVDDKDGLIEELRAHVLAASNKSDDPTVAQQPVHRSLPGIMQHRLDQVWSGLNKPMQNKFIVIVNRYSEVPLPITCDLESSLHVVEGNW